MPPSPGPTLAEALRDRASDEDVGAALLGHREGDRADQHGLGSGQPAVAHDHEVGSVGGCLGDDLLRRLAPADRGPDRDALLVGHRGDRVLQDEFPGLRVPDEHERDIGFQALREREPLAGRPVGGGRAVGRDEHPPVRRSVRRGRRGPSPREQDVARRVRRDLAHDTAEDLFAVEETPAAEDDQLGVRVLGRPEDRRARIVRWRRRARPSHPRPRRARAPSRRRRRRGPRPRRRARV